MVGFLVFSGFIIALGEANRRSKARSEREVAERRRIEDELRKSQQELEHRVKERTAELEQNVAETAEKAVLLDLANDAIFVKTVCMAQFLIGIKERKGLYGWSNEEALGRSSHELLRTEFPIPLAEIESQRLLGRRDFATQGGTAFRSWLQAAGLRCGITRANQSLGSKSTRT